MKAFTVVVCLIVAGCGGGSTRTPSATDAGTDGPVVDAGSDSGADAGSDAGSDAGVVDAGAADAAAAMCTPGWHPTSCGDCGGTFSAGTCAQGCDPASCGDGRLYEATCDDATHTCHCSIDGHEACTCTFTIPTTTIGCEPVEWGGSNCCWNVG